MNHLKYLVLLGSALVPGTSLIAQNSQVFPTDHATREGSSSFTSFAITNGVNRTQVIFDRRDLMIPNGASINRIGFRPDAAGAGTGAAVQLEIFMGQTDRSPTDTSSATGISNTFANNYVNPPVTVFNLQILTLPNQTPVSPGPSTTPLMITLDTPFAYDSSLNLVVEFQVRANNAGNTSFRYPFDRARVVSESRLIGTACTTSNSRTPDLTAGQAQIAGSWRLTVRNSLANAPGLMLLGDSTSAHTGIPLPFALPGAPGCDWLVSFFAMVPVGTTSGGSGSLSISIPRIPQLYGLEFFAQHWIADLFANQLGIVTSNAVGTVFGRLPLMTYVERRNNYTSGTGSVSRQNGPVMLIDWQ